MVVDDPRILIGTRRRRHNNSLAIAFVMLAEGGQAAISPLVSSYSRLTIQSVSALILTLAYRTLLKPSLPPQSRSKRLGRKRRHSTGTVTPCAKLTRPDPVRRSSAIAYLRNGRTIDIDLTRSQSLTRQPGSFSSATAHYLAAGCD